MLRDCGCAGARAAAFLRPRSRRLISSSSFFSDCSWRFLRASATQVLPLSNFSIPTPSPPRVSAVEVFGLRWLCSAVGALGSCWNCGIFAEGFPFVVCHSCLAVQPVDRSVDYFQIFGLEKKFDVGEGNLEGVYKNWQKKVHPDLVHSKSERERDYAAEHSSRIIDAYRTLTDPLARAIYMMRLEAVDVDEERTIQDPAFLHEIMEMRESVDEARDKNTLHDIQSQMNGKFKYWSDFFSRSFQNGYFGDARISIDRMTYYRRILDEIMAKL